MNCKCVFMMLMQIVPKAIVQIPHNQHICLNITNSATTFDADTPVVFEVQSFDNYGNINHPFVPVGRTIEWSTTWEYFDFEFFSNFFESFN